MVSILFLTKRKSLLTDTLLLISIVLCLCGANQIGLLIRSGYASTLLTWSLSGRGPWIEWKRLGRYACVVIVRDGLDGVISALDECWIEWKMIARYAS